MAQMTYEDYLKLSQKTSTSESYPRIQYFALKDDGDSAIVRFNLGTLADIKIISRHRVLSSENKVRIVGCLRTSPLDPLDVCPLCAAGEKVAFRAYIPLLTYEQNENNETVPVPVMWEQAPKIRDTLKEFFNDYGDLRNQLFKIVRHGKKGDTATSYTILPANPAVYKEDVFKKDFSGFEHLDYERFVATKTAEDMEVFLREGDFPFKSTASEHAETAEKPLSKHEEEGLKRRAEIQEETEEEPAPRPRRTYSY